MALPAATRQALAVAIQANESVLLWGAPGGGKSRLIEGIAAAYQRPCEVVIGSIREASDFAGLPVRTDDGVVFSPPAWARRAADQGDSVVFLDELTTAAPQVQAAMLRIVLEREVGDLSLPGGVAIVAAANPPETAAGGYDLAAPLANRFCHLHWETNAQEWVSGMLSGWPIEGLPRLPDDRAAETIRWVSVVTAFVKAKPTLLHSVPRDTMRQGEAWPSPRTWDLVVRLASAADAAGVDDAVRNLLIIGSVGEGAGLEFLAFIQQLDLPDPETLLADPTSLRLPERNDRAFAVLGSVVAAIAADPTAERWQAGWDVLRVALQQTKPDVAAVAARSLIDLRRPNWKIPTGVREFAPLLRRAGVMT